MQSNLKTTQYFYRYHDYRTRRDITISSRFDHIIRSLKVKGHTNTNINEDRNNADPHFRRPADGCPQSWCLAFFVHHIDAIEKPE
jgi:hypothetical protein